MAFSSEDLALMLVSGSISVFAAAGTGDVLVISGNFLSNSLVDTKLMFVMKEELGEMVGLTSTWASTDSFVAKAGGEGYHRRH